MPTAGSAKLYQAEQGRADWFVERYLCKHTTDLYSRTWYTTASGRSGRCCAVVRSNPPLWHDIPKLLYCLTFFIILRPPSPAHARVPADTTQEMNGKPREPTLEELRAECRRRGMTGFSHLKKNELIRRMAGTLYGRVQKHLRLKTLDTRQQNAG